VVQRVIVRKLGMGVYELIAGERRLRASKLAGIRSIPAIIYEAEHSSLMMMTVIENLQRSNLNFVEEAKSYDNMIRQFGFTEEELAKKLGKNPYEVANRLRILTLPREVIQKLAEHNLTQYHANSLLRLKDGELQKEVADIIISRGFDVAQTDAYVDKLISKNGGKPGAHICKLQDVRILTNTIKQISELLNRSGIGSCVQVRDAEGSTRYTIVVPKQLS
jgi:ParB family chromosome partitioning protein